MEYNLLIDELNNLDHNIFDASDYKRDENIHRIFLYPAMMIPSSQKIVIDILSKYLPKDINMFDPFMGASTAILSCMEKGFNVYGQDINPLAVLISKVKVSTLNTLLLKLKIERVRDFILRDSSTSIDVSFDRIDKWFNHYVQIDLSKIRRAIKNEDDIQYRRFFWVILAETIRVDSNDRTSTYKLHQRSELDIRNRKVSVIKDFFKLAERSVGDIEKFNNKLMAANLINNDKYIGTAEVRWGNSLIKINSGKIFSLLVSSPPYGDNHTTVTYGQHSYLALQWIDRQDIDLDIDYDYLKTSQEIDRTSLGGKLDRQKISKCMDGLLSKTPTLKSLFASFEKEKDDKINKIISFINDFDISLNAILNKMSNRSFLVWTIGNRHVSKKEIPNDQILIELMEYRNIRLIYQGERNIQNKTMPSRNKTTKTMTKEKILIFYKNNE